MYSVSQNFMTAMLSPIQQHKLTGTIGALSFTQDNVLSGSFNISNQICDSAEIGIGKVYIGELSATFRNVGIADGAWQGKVITPTFSLCIDPDHDTWESVPLGVYTVAEATISQSGVTVKAYDNMTKFDKYCTGWHGGGGSGATESSVVSLGNTAYDILYLICKKCGVTFGMTRPQVAALANSGYSLDLFEENDITTYRDMLSWIAQVLCCNASINRAGELVMIPFKSTSDYTYDENHRHNGATFADYLTKVTAITLDFKPLQITYSYAANPNDGLTYELGQNPYLQLGATVDRDAACNAIVSAFGAVSYTPFNVNLTGCPIYDLGDVLTFSGGMLSSSKKGAITSFNYTFNGQYSLACGGKNPAEANAKNKSDKRTDAISSSLSSQKSTITVVRNAAAATIGDGATVPVIDYPFEVTDSINLTNVSTEIIMTTTGTETEAGDVYTIGDIVAKVILYLDGAEIGDLYPQFIVDEGKDTINFDYALKNLSVGAHNYEVRLQMAGGGSSVAANDVHEFLWGNGITFEVYLKSIQVVSGQKVFRIGANLDTSDWVVKGINNNGTTITPLADWSTDPADGTTLSEAGEVDVEVIYDELSTEYTVDVVYAPYDNCKVWSYSNKISLLDENGTKEEVTSFSVHASVFCNDHEFFSRYNNTITYLGRDSTGSSTPANTMTGNPHGAKGGYVYYVDSGSTRTFYRVYGNSMTGDDSEEEVGSYTRNSSAFTFLCPGYYTGDIIPFLDGTNYGYIDLSDNTIEPALVDISTLTGYTTSFSQAYCLTDDGDLYVFIGNGEFKMMHTCISGTHHIYDLTAIDGLTRGSYTAFSYGLNHDKTNNCLVLYICRTDGSSMTSMAITTHGYTLSMNGHTVKSTITTPNYIDLPVDPNATDIAANEAASYFRVWCNGSGIDTYYPDTVDGIRANMFSNFLRWASNGYGGYLGKPNLYAEFSSPELTPTSPQYLIGTSYTASVYNTVQRMCIIDNLYLEEGDGNTVREW